MVDERWLKKGWPLDIRQNIVDCKRKRFPHPRFADDGLIANEAADMSAARAVEENALDRAWVAMCALNQDENRWRPVDWIEGALHRQDSPDEYTRELIRAIVDAYNDDCSLV